MSRRTRRTRDVFSSWPLAAWKRRLKRSFSRSASCSVSWLSVLARRSDASMGSGLLAETRDEPRRDRQFAAGQRERLLGEIGGHAVELEQDAAGLDAGHPEFRGALAAAHADLGRLLRHRHVGEDADPEAAGALHVARDRAARGLDLARGETRRLHRLHAEGAEIELGAAFGLAVDAALEGLAEFRSLGGKHRRLLSALSAFAALAVRAAGGRH